MKVVKNKKNFKVGDKILIDCEKGIAHGLVWREEHEPKVVLPCDKNWKILNTKGVRLADLQSISQASNIEEYGVDIVIYLDLHDEPLPAVDAIIAYSRKNKAKWIVGQVEFVDGTSQYVWCDQGEILNVSDSLNTLFELEEDEDSDECSVCGCKKKCCCNEDKDCEKDSDCDDEEEFIFIDKNEDPYANQDEECESTPYSDEEEEDEEGNCFSFPGCGCDGCENRLTSVPPCKSEAPSTADIMARCDFIETLMVNAFEKLEMAALDRINEIDKKVDGLVKKLNCKSSAKQKSCCGKCCKKGKK